MWRVLWVVVAIACSRPAPSIGAEARLAALHELDRASDVLPLRMRGAILAVWHRTMFASAVAPRTEDVVAQFEAASTAEFYAKDPVLLPEMYADLSALERRGAATDDDRTRMFRALVDSGQLDQARAFAARYPRIPLEAIPPTRNAPDVVAGQPSAWRVDDAGNLERHRIDLEPPQVILVSHPDCHFSANAMTAILADPALSAIFSQHATLLAPQTPQLGLATLQAWNRAHPTQPTVLVADQRDWPLDDWDTPNFYFVRGGRVLAHVKGWQTDAQKANLLAGLAAIGLYDSRSR